MNVQITKLGSGSYEPKPLGNVEITKLPEQSGEEGTLGFLGRNLVGGASTTLKTAVDLPGNIAKAIGGVANLGISAGNKLGSYLGMKPEKLIDTDILPNISEYTVEPLEKALLPEGYTQPKSAGEEKYHEFVSDVTSLLAPIGGPGMKLARAAGVSAAGGLGKWAAQQVGLGEGGQEGVKLGTMLASSLLGRSGLKTKRDAFYKQAEEAIPEGKNISAKAIEPVLKDLEKTFSKGEMTPSKTFMADRIKSIRSKIKDGNVPVDEVWELKRNMNEHIQDFTKPYGVEKKLPVLSKALSDQLYEYGKENKAFGTAFSQAEDIFKGMTKASPINAFLQKHVSPANIGKVTGGVLLGYIPPHAGAGIIGTSLSAKEGVKIFERFKNSPTIRKYYAQVIKEASRQNIPQMNKAIKELDRYITQEYPENASQ